MEMRCYRKIFGISYREHVTNEEVRQTIRQHTGPYKELLATVKRKLQWYGHVTRSSGRAKTILQGTVEGARRRGRQKWADNVREWTGADFATTKAQARNRQTWREQESVPCGVPMTQRVMGSISKMPKRVQTHSICHVNVDGVKRP